MSKLVNKAVFSFLILFLPFQVFAKGSVKVESNPGNADIYIDGINTGQTTPYTFTDLSSYYYAFHNITLRKTGYTEPSMDDFYSFRGDDVTLFDDFQSLSKGSLTVQSNPTGAQIYVDGVDTGQVTPYTFTNLSNSGYYYHTIVVYKAGCPGPACKEVALYQTSNNAFFDLLKETTGQATIQSNPSGAQIYLDGIDTGQTTPYTFTDLSSYYYKYHWVVLRKSGYVKQGPRNFSIDPGEKDMIGIDLEILGNPFGAPSTPETTGAYSSTTTLTFSWARGTANDTACDIVGYYLQVGSFPGGNDYYDCYVSTFLSKTITDCASGKIYFARVRARNSAGEYTEYSGISDGITVDTSPPMMGEIRISREYNVLLEWDPAVDNESGIGKYWYAIGTLQSEKDISSALSGNTDGWIDNGNSTKIRVPDLALETGKKYYFLVKAENGAGIQGDVVSAAGAIEMPQVKYFNLSQVKVYPNPFVLSGGGASAPLMKFNRLPENAILSIYTLSGVLVCTLKDTDSGDTGEILWDGKNRNGEYVCTGVYIYVIKSANGFKKTGKIAFIKSK